jgi:hypothetical protein
MKKSVFMLFLSLSLAVALGSAAFAATVVPYTYGVEIDGVAVPGVTTVDGPSMTVVTDATGAKVYSYHATYYSNLTNNFGFLTWAATTKSGMTDRRSISIIRYKSAVEDSRFNLYNCTPSFDIKNGLASTLLGTVSCDTLELKSATGNSQGY